jgi:hypothetical protein
MKRLLFIIAALCAFSVTPVLITSCAAPSTRVVQVQTLKIVGQSAEAAVGVSAQLYQQGNITAEQARAVMDFYNLRFQPGYRLAVAAAQSNLDSIASPELAALAAQLVQLVATFQPKKP